MAFNIRVRKARLKKIPCQVAGKKIYVRGTVFPLLSVSGYPNLSRYGPTGQRVRRVWTIVPEKGPERILRPRGARSRNTVRKAKRSGPGRALFASRARGKFYGGAGKNRAFLGE